MEYPFDLDERDGEYDGLSTSAHGKTECRSAGAVTRSSTVIAIELAP